MKTVTVINEKGGVGKTTTAVHIAAGLAAIGYRVMLVDSDPQGNATSMLGSKKEPGLYNLLVRGAPFNEVVRVVPPEVYEFPDRLSKGELFLIPGNVESKNIANSIDDAFAIAECFDALQNSVDVVIFDTSPTPSLLHGAIYLATNAVIYPTLCEYLSLDGLMESIKHRRDADAFRSKLNMPAIHMLGIVPTQYRSSVLEHQENVEDLKKHYGDAVWQPIPQRIIWTEASRMSKMVWNYAPNSAAARDALRLVRKAHEEISRVKA